MPLPNLQANTPTSHKLEVQKVRADAGIICLRFSGTIDEDFNGARLAESVTAKNLVLDLGEVKRISSYGIAEWTEFIRAARKRADHICMIACSQKVMDQLNIVNEFAGPAILHSFLAPYRCEYCDADTVRLFQLETEWETIRSRNLPEIPCQCGQSMTMDDDPGIYLSYASKQGPIPLPPDVQAFVTTELANRGGSHGVVSGQSFWAEKFVKGKSSFLRLSGSLDGAFPAEKLADGLEGTIVLDVGGLSRVFPAGAALWRNFTQDITPTAHAIYLVGVTPAFFEYLTSPEDLGPKGEIHSLLLDFLCSSCRTASQCAIDVAEDYDLLQMATPPERKCPDCKSSTDCIAPESVLARLRLLKKPDMPAPVRKFMEEALRKVKEGNKPAQAEAARRRSRVAGLFMAAAALGVVAAAATVAILMFQRERQQSQVQTEESAKLKRRSGAARPNWVISDMPLHAGCKVVGEELQCAGVSTYASDLEEGRREAAASALEASVQFVAVQVADATWQRKVTGLYAAARAAKLENLEAAREKSDPSRYEAAIKDVVDARLAVVKSLRKTAGSLAPTQVSGEYWEEYEMPGRTELAYLVFAQVRVPVAQAKRMAQVYSTPVTVRGAKVITVFPGVAWRFPDVVSGAMLLEVDSGGLRAIGLTDRYIVTSVQDRVVESADFFSTALEEELAKSINTGGSIKLVVKTGDTLPVEFSHPVQAIVRPSPSAARGGARGGSGPRDRPLNTWDRVGGYRDQRDDPRE